MIKSVGYNPKNQIFAVKFNNGSGYIYKDVPSTIIDGFITAESQGKFFNANIKNKYEYIQIVKKEKWKQYLK